MELLLVIIIKQILQHLLSLVVKLHETGGIKSTNVHHFLRARRYASAGISDRNVSVRPSVRLSVCHALVLCQNEES